MRRGINKRTSTYILCFLFFIVKPQTINTCIGTGIAGFSGDGGQASIAQIFYPYSLTFDAIGNLYIADMGNNAVRKVNPSGIISTIAGTGPWGYSGDGGMAINAELADPLDVAVDLSGNVYISDYSNNCVRKINTSGIISTFAGNGTAGYSGDGGPASSAQLSNQIGIAVDASGNLYISDTFNNRIRKINNSGIISTIAGTSSTISYSGDGGPAILANLGGPEGIEVDAIGNIYIADAGNHRIRKIDTFGIISTIAGTGVSGFNGDGGLAINAQLNHPVEINVDVNGNIYISDYNNNRIRKINTSGVISTYAGNGIYAFGGDGGPALSAQCAEAFGVSTDASGNLFLSAWSYNRIRKVTLSTNIDNTPFANTIKMFPNPSSTIFNFELQAKSEIIITNMFGQEILNEKRNAGKQIIDLQNQPDGIYFVKIIQDGIQSVGKIIKE